jgi:hypothetical protein
MKHHRILFKIVEIKMEASLLYCKCFPLANNEHELTKHDGDRLERRVVSGARRGPGRGARVNVEEDHGSRSGMAPVV